jgi:hypothetical protein
MLALAPSFIKRQPGGIQEFATRNDAHLNSTFAIRHSQLLASLLLRSFRSQPSTCLRLVGASPAAGHWEIEPGGATLLAGFEEDRRRLCAHEQAMSNLP